MKDRGEWVRTPDGGEERRDLISFEIIRYSRHTVTIHADLYQAACRHDYGKSPDDDELSDREWVRSVVKEEPWEFTNRFDGDLVGSCGTMTSEHCDEWVVAEVAVPSEDADALNSHHDQKLVEKGRQDGAS